MILKLPKIVILFLFVQKQAKPVLTNTAPKKLPASVTKNSYNAPKVVPQKQQVVTTSSVPTAPKATTTLNKQELINYKIALRNKIAHKINFTNVIGDGTCAIIFTISDSGILQNRKFKKQSKIFVSKKL